MPPTRTALQFASGLSRAGSTDAAIDAVLARLQGQLRHRVDLVVVFATMHHADGLELLQRRLTQTLRPEVLMISTASGVLGVGEAIEAGPGLSVLAASLPDGVSLEPLAWEQKDWPGLLESTAAQEPTEAVTASATDPARAVLLLADPFTSPMADVLPALQARYPEVPIVGGLVSGSGQPGESRLLLNGRLQDEGAIGLVLRGEIEVTTCLSQGCRPIGEPLVVTDIEQQQLRCLGGRNALATVQGLAERLPERDQELIKRHGLFIGRVVNECKRRFGRGDFLVRGLANVDTDQGHLMVADPDLTRGQTVQFHVLDPSSAEADLGLLLEGQKLQGPAAGALLFDCRARGSGLWSRADADPRLIHDALGDTPMTGLFAAGEIGPAGNGCDVHSHSASLIIFRQPTRAASARPSAR